MLQAINLTKSYGNHTAVDNLNLNIQAGEIYAMLGANGAGKSTTINMFMGFTQPSSGQALIGDPAIDPDSRQARHLTAYIPENVQLYGKLTAIENLGYFSGLSGYKLSDQSLSELLLHAGLHTAFHNKKLETFSKGMRQKVGIAIALSKKAKVLFLDEPTSGLDPHASNEFSVLLKSLSKAGVTILMATHDLFRAREDADRIGIMRKGRLVKELNAEAVSHTDLETIYLDVIGSNENHIL